MIFKDFDSSKNLEIPFSFGDDEAEGSDVSLRFFNDITSYRPALSHFEILVVVEGDATAIFGNESVVFDYRTVGFFFPGEARKLETSPGSDIVLYSLLISPYLLTEFCNLVAYRALDLLFSGSGHRHFRMYYKDFEYFVHLAEIIISSDIEQSRILTRRAAYNLVSQLILSFEDNSTYPDWFETFLDKIHMPEYFLSPMSEIYKLAPYSQPMLNSYFNRFMGETLVSYITKLKINYACNLLRFSEFTVVDIAAKTKYSSLSHFNHIFKKQVGMTPSEYRVNNSLLAHKEREE